MRLIFAPGCFTAIDMNDIAIQAEPDYTFDDCVVLVIGDAFNPDNPDSPHPSWKLRPQRSLSGPENLRASAFNEKIVSAQTSHCID